MSAQKTYVLPDGSPSYGIRTGDVVRPVADVAYAGDSAEVIIGKASSFNCVELIAAADTRTAPGSQ